MKSRLSLSYYEKNIFRKYIYIFIEYLVGLRHIQAIYESCLLYTSDAADE